MNASELINHLARIIKEVGDRPVILWNLPCQKSTERQLESVYPSKNETRDDLPKHCISLVPFDETFRR